jgi:hypothetical protein
MLSNTRQLLVNAVSVLVTALLLLLIGLVAQSQASGDFDFSASACPTGKPYGGKPSAPLAVGFVTDPFKIGTFQKAVGARNRLAFYSNFEAWGKDRDPSQYFHQATLNRVLPYVTFEPWANVPNDGSQANAQPQFSNASIAAGGHDAYLTKWADAVKASSHPVYIRYAHEMNGVSYPWSLDPASYQAAWRHMVDLFRQRGASNARFVFAVNANTYQSKSAWCSGFMQYWPGAEYVDAVGMSTIQFGGPKVKNYSVANFAKRLAVLRRFGKPLQLSEANAEYGHRVKWFTDLRRYLHKSPWVEALVISQVPSRSVGIDGNKGRMSWDIRKDKATLRIVKAVMNDRPLLGRKKPNSKTHNQR